MKEKWMKLTSVSYDFKMFLFALLSMILIVAFYGEEPIKKRTVSNSNTITYTKKTENESYTITLKNVPIDDIQKILKNIDSKNEFKAIIEEKMEK